MSPPNFSAMNRGERQHDHGLADDPCRGDDADVAPLVVGLVDRFSGHEVGRRQGPGERRDGLDRTANDERLAVRDATGQATGVVRSMDPPTAAVAALDDVVDGRSESARLLEPEPELDALDDVDAHDRCGEGGIEPAVPVDVRPKPDRETVDHDLEHATDRVARRPRFVDAGDHRGLRLRIRTAEWRRVRVLARAGRIRRVESDPAHLGGERPDLDAERPQVRPGDPARGDTRGGLASRGALEDVPDIVEAVLQRTGQIGVARADSRHGRRPLVATLGRVVERDSGLVPQRFDRHHLGPVRPVAIPNEQEDRRTEGHSVSNATQDLGAVLLDRLARTAAVATLATREIDREVIGGERKPGGHALDGDAKRWSVRFAGCQEAEGAHLVVGSAPEGVSRPPRPTQARHPPAHLRPIAGHRPVPPPAGPASAPTAQADRSRA